MTTAPVVTPAVRVSLPAADVAGRWMLSAIELAALPAAEFLGVDPKTLRLLDTSLSLDGPRRSRTRSIPPLDIVCHRGIR